MLIFWSCSQGVRAYQQVKDTCLVRPDSSVVRASGICLDGPGFNSQSGCLFCLTLIPSSITFLCQKERWNITIFLFDFTPTLPFFIIDYLIPLIPGHESLYL
jgi:hypothetical protein